MARMMSLRRLCDGEDYPDDDGLTVKTRLCGSTSIRFMSPPLAQRDSGSFLRIERTDFIGKTILGDKICRNKWGTETVIHLVRYTVNR